MRLKILLAVLGFLLLASGIYIAANNLKPKSKEPSSVLSLEDKSATKSADIKTEPAETKPDQANQSETPTPKPTTYALANTVESIPNNPTGTTQNSQNPTPTPPNQTPTNQNPPQQIPPQDNLPSTAYCNSEKAYLDSKYQSDVAAENRYYDQLKQQLTDELGRSGGIYGEAGQSKLALLLIDHNYRLSNLKRDYDRAVSNLVYEGCSF